MCVSNIKLCGVWKRKPVFKPVQSWYVSCDPVSGLFALKFTKYVKYACSLDSVAV